MRNRIKDDGIVRPAVFAITVYGRPVPQGSMNAFANKEGKTIISHGNKNVKPYRQNITDTALWKLRDMGYDIRPTDRGGMGALYPAKTPLAAALVFYFARPKSVRDHVIAPTTKPDQDKLARAVFDALTKIVMDDDKDIVASKVIKLYGAPERTEIAIGPARFASPQPDQLDEAPAAQMHLRLEGWSTESR